MSHWLRIYRILFLYLRPLDRWQHRRCENRKRGKRYIYSFYIFVQSKAMPTLEQSAIFALRVRRVLWGPKSARAVGRHGRDAVAADAASHSSAWYYILEHAASTCARYFECCFHHLSIYLGSVVERSWCSAAVLVLPISDNRKTCSTLVFTSSSVDFVDV